MLEWVEGRLAQGMELKWILVDGPLVAGFRDIPYGSLYQRFHVLQLSGV